jgi:hypothetical protein
MLGMRCNLICDRLDAVEIMYMLIGPLTRESSNGGGRGEEIMESLRGSKEGFNVDGGCLWVFTTSICGERNGLIDRLLPSKPTG